MSEKISLKGQTTEPERDDALSYREKPNFSPTANSSHDIPFLQKTIGNRAVYRLFKTRTIQAKLKIGRTNDVYEQEADNAAEQVIKNGLAERPGLSQTETTIQCSPAEGETATTTEPASEVTQPPSETTQPPSPVSTTQPEETKTPTPGLIVEDSATELLPGQMKRSAFLAQLRAAVCSTAEAALSGSIWSAMGCPWIDRWFGYYAGRDSQSIERAIQRYTGASGAGSAAEYIPIICLRVQIGIVVWRTTGEVIGVPEAALAGVPETSSEAGGETSMPETSSEEVPETPPSTTDSIHFKSRGNNAKESVDPKSVQSQLDTGHSLDSNTKSKMETAFGQDFSGVKIHTDTKAGQLSDDLNARAFTVGKDVAFGSGEYQPGTLIGDALIAHELAHTVQQGGGSSSSSPMQKGETESGTLEEDADTSAVGAMVSLWGGIKGGLANIARNAMPRLKSGLRLQRCTKITPPEPAEGRTPNYDSFSDAEGHMTDSVATDRMIRNWQQLENVYSDAALGNKRAIQIIAEIENVYARTGIYVAEQNYSFECTLPVYREMSGKCIPNWSFLDYLRPDKPAGIRLRRIIGDAYRKKAEELSIRNEIIANALSLLLAGAMARGAMSATAREAATISRETETVIAGEGKALSAERQAASGGPPSPGTTRINVLVVGAERADEFAYANQVASRGNQVVVVNPKTTEAAKAFQRGGGNFVNAKIEELPRNAQYQIIREDIPVPTPVYQQAAEFVTQRFIRLAPGGRWVIVTESPEFVRSIRAAADIKGGNVFIRQISAAHEAAPQSAYPRERSRFVVIVEKP